MQKNSLNIYTKKIDIDVLKNTRKFKFQKSCSYSEYFHIKGVGMENFFNFVYFSQGLIGKIQNRKCVKIFLHFIASEIQKLNIIITGAIGSGKMSLVVGIGITVKKYTPFVAISELELNFPCASRLENLTQYIRKAIGIRFYESSIIIEGKILDIKPNRKSSYTRNRFYAKLVLKYNQIQSTYQISKKTYDMILHKTIKRGDFISIDQRKSSIKKKFLSFNFKNKKKHNKNPERYKTQQHTMTLHELDFLNLYSKHVLSDIFADNSKEIPDEIREKVNKTASKWQKSKKIKLLQGIFLLYDMIFLSEELSAYLIKIIENFSPPSVLLFIDDFEPRKKNNKVTPFCGISVNFLDRFLLIRTNLCSYNEIKDILYIKENQKTTLITKEAHELLIKITIQSGVKYGIYIMCTATSIFNYKSVKITYNNIKKSFSMFIDEKKLKKYTFKIKKTFKSISMFFKKNTLYVK